jgi:hypothetical protein
MSLERRVTELSCLLDRCNRRILEGWKKSTQFVFKKGVCPVVDPAGLHNVGSIGMYGEQVRAAARVAAVVERAETVAGEYLVCAQMRNAGPDQARRVKHEVIAVALDLFQPWIRIDVAIQAS